MSAVKLKTYEDVWKIALQMSAELMEESAKEMDWEAIAGGTNMSISDLVEKRLVGLEDYTIQLARRLAVAGQRLEHVEDSPRKGAANAIVENYKEWFGNYLDKKAFSFAFVEAKKLFYDPNYIIPQNVRREINRRDSENAAELDQINQERQVYDQMFTSFFKDHAIPDRMPTDPSEILAENRVFERIARIMPQGEEYAPFRTRAGYVNQPALAVNPVGATMVVEPNAVTGVTMDNFVSKLRSPNPKKADMEWGYGTFDRMMEGLYTDTNLERIRNSQNSLLETVFIDGKNVRSWLAKKDTETQEEYEARAKCEVVAYALEGKGKIDICPLREGPEGFAMADPVPMRLKVNLKEEIPVWKRALRFFHIKSETKKEKAERISMEDLREEERLGAVREQAALLRERERVRRIAVQTEEQESRYNHKDDQAYFGFLGNSSDEIWSQMSGILQAKVEGEFGKVRLLDTMGRMPSRVNFVRLFALTRGMTLDEVLSDDPALDERKGQIGREMVEQFSLMEKEEYEKQHGEKGDYKAYLEEKRERTFAAFQEIHQRMMELPFQPMADTSLETLLANYHKNYFLGYGAGDFRQSMSKFVKAKAPDVFEKILDDTVAIEELRHGSDYVNYLATDTAVFPDLITEMEKGIVTNGLYAKVALEQCQKSAAGCRTCGEIPRHITPKQCENTRQLYIDMTEFASSRRNHSDITHYLTTGQDPVCLYDPEKKAYTLGSARQIHQKVLDADKSWQAEFEEIAEKDIQNAKRRVRLQGEVTGKEAEGIRHRAWQRDVMKGVLDKSIDLQKADDQAYFGFLGNTSQSIGEEIDEISIVARDGNQVQLMKNLDRESSRVSIIRAYALTKGMTLQEVLSGDPSLNERKREIGAEFLDRIRLVGKAEYQEINGPDADYDQYLRERQTGAFQMAREIHEAIVGLPYQPLEDLKAETLAARYEEISFFRDASKDFQQNFASLKDVYGNELDEMNTAEDAISELDHITKYCKFLVSDTFVMPDRQTQSDSDKIAEALIESEGAKRFLKDTSHMTRLGQICETIDLPWKIAHMEMQMNALPMVSGSPEGYEETLHYVTTGTKPVCLFDEKENRFVLGSVKAMEQKQKELGGAQKQSHKEASGKKDQEKILAKDEFKKDAKIMAGPRR